MKVYKQNASIICRPEDDQYLFYNKETGQICILNWSAYEIWCKCDGKNTTEEIKLALSKEFEIQEHILSHIDAMFENMEKSVLILEA